MKHPYLIVRDGIPATHPIFAHLERYAHPVATPEEADTLVVCGGDGTMLRAVRAYKDMALPFVGINFGHIGFLMNKPKIRVLNELIERVQRHTN